MKQKQRWHKHLRGNTLDTGKQCETHSWRKMAKDYFVCGLGSLPDSTLGCLIKLIQFWIQWTFSGPSQLLQGTRPHLLRIAKCRWQVAHCNTIRRALRCQLEDPAMWRMPGTAWFIMCFYIFYIDVFNLSWFWFILYIYNSIIFYNALYTASSCFIMFIMCSSCARHIQLQLLYIRAVVCCSTTLFNTWRIRRHLTAWLPM